MDKANDPRELLSGPTLEALLMLNLLDHERKVKVCLTVAVNGETSCKHQLTAQPPFGVSISLAFLAMSAWTFETWTTPHAKLVSMR